jgi:hypothetical protein
VRPRTTESFERREESRISIISKALPTKEGGKNAYRVDLKKAVVERPYPPAVKPLNSEKSRHSQSSFLRLSCGEEGHRASVSLKMPRRRELKANRKKASNRSENPWPKAEAAEVLSG